MLCGPIFRTQFSEETGQLPDPEFSKIFDSTNNFSSCQVQQKVTIISPVPRKLQLAAALSASKTGTTPETPFHVEVKLIKKRSRGVLLTLRRGNRSRTPPNTTLCMASAVSAGIPA